MRKSRFETNLSEITAFIDTQPHHVFSDRDIASVYLYCKTQWKLPQSLSKAKFIEQCLQHTPFKKQVIEFPTQTYLRYSWKDFSKYEFFLSLVKGSYFTHQTALFFNQLIDKEPATIYLNFEQFQKPYLKKATLSQDGIDGAFQKPQRMSQRIAQFQGDTIYLLNGQHTDKCGVLKIKTSFGEVATTSMERTLIDITVRPEYAGGISEVFNVFKRVKNTVSVEKIAAILNQIKFIYPYHQAIGFLLQESGFSNINKLSLLKDFGFKYNFYLSRQIANPAYSEEWKLFYPRNLNNE